MLLLTYPLVQHALESQSSQSLGLVPEWSVDSDSMLSSAQVAGAVTAVMVMKFNSGWTPMDSSNIPKFRPSRRVGQHDISNKVLEVDNSFLMLTFQAVVVANDTASLWGVLVNPRSSRTIQANKTTVFQRHFWHSVIVMFMNFPRFFTTCRARWLRAAERSCELRRVYQCSVVGFICCLWVSSLDLKIFVLTIIWALNNHVHPSPSTQRPSPINFPDFLHEQDVRIGIQGGKSIRIPLPHLFKCRLRRIKVPWQPSCSTAGCYEAYRVFCQTHCCGHLKRMQTGIPSAWTYVPWSKVAILGMVITPLIGILIMDI